MKILKRNIRSWPSPRERIIRTPWITAWNRLLGRYGKTRAIDDAQDSLSILMRNSTMLKNRHGGVGEPIANPDIMVLRGGYQLGRMFFLEDIRGRGVIVALSESEKSRGFRTLMPMAEEVYDCVGARVYILAEFARERIVADLRDGMDNAVGYAP